MIAEFYTKNKTKVTLLAARKGADFLELCVAVAWGLLLPTRPKRCFLGSFSWCHSGKKKQIDDVSPIKKGWFSSQTPCLVSGEWRQDITSLNPPVYGSTPHTPGVVGWEGTKVAIVERQALWRETKARDLGLGFKRPVDSGESRV